MINLKNISLGLLCMSCVAIMPSCSSFDDTQADIQEELESNEAHTCELVLNVSKIGFDDEPTSRSAAQWENGDKIYLTFTTASGTICGDATYNDSTWSVVYYGTLIVGTAAKCVATYFENAVESSNGAVTINENTAIYEDLNATYTYAFNSLAVVANLKPKTGRIRFAGTDNEKITICGISHYTFFDSATGKYFSSSLALNKTVADGYTPYIYGYFTETEQLRINLITSTSGYTKYPTNSIYKAGESGYMTIPTESDDAGWQNLAIFNVNGAEFTMIPVKYAGANFLLAQTETTNELYNAVNGISKTQNQQNPYNFSKSSYSDTFLSTLNKISGLNFRYPNVNEWQYAYKGGEFSQGYTYSGSNTINDVAWYYSNSGSGIHAVKQKQPNELGFYDMSGNYAEYCTDGGVIKSYGGYYACDASQCLASYVTSSSSNSTLRLALSIPANN